jgi:uncharacterized protein DUF2510
MSTPEAGWYVNPSGPGRRYWDGERWTDHVDDSGPTQAQYVSPSISAPPPPPVYQQPPPPPPYVYGQPQYAQPTQGASGLVVVGYITAVIIPIVGFILGIVAATRRDEPQTARHGVWVIVVSVVAFFVWLAILNSGSGSTY